MSAVTHRYPEPGSGVARQELAHRALAVLLLVGLAVMASILLRPERVANVAPLGTLERGIPSAFGPWVQTPTQLVQVNLTVSANGDRTNDRPYDEVVTRNYRDAQGQFVMLAVAYAAVQQQEIKIHRPDLCYPAQGFVVESWSTTTLPRIRGERGPITAVHMVTRRNQRREAVVYWLRTGSNYGQRMWDGRLEILTEGVKGRIPDGILVRASRIIDTPRQADSTLRLLDDFLFDLYSSSDAAAQAVLVR